MGNYYFSEEKQIPKTMQLFVKSVTWKLLQLLKHNNQNYYTYVKVNHIKARFNATPWLR